MPAAIEKDKPLPHEGGKGGVRTQEAVAQKRGGAAGRADCVQKPQQKCARNVDGKRCKRERGAVQLPQSTSCPVAGKCPQHSAKANQCKCQPNRRLCSFLCCKMCVNGSSKIVLVFSAGFGQGARPPMPTKGQAPRCPRRRKRRRAFARLPQVQPFARTG